MSHTAIEDVSEEGDGVDMPAAELEGMLDSDVSYHWHTLAITLRYSFQSFFLWTMARRTRRV